VNMPWSGGAADGRPGTSPHMTKGQGARHAALAEPAASTTERGTTRSREAAPQAIASVTEATECGGPPRRPPQCYGTVTPLMTTDGCFV
jgi:hypothetical protein